MEKFYIRGKEQTDFFSFLFSFMFYLIDYKGGQCWKMKHCGGKIDHVWEDGHVKFFFFFLSCLTYYKGNQFWKMKHCGTIYVSRQVMPKLMDISGCLKDQWTLESTKQCRKKID